MQLVTVGNHMCLFRPDNHALALLRPDVADVCANIVARASDGNVNVHSSSLPEPASSLHAMLADAGFLDGAVRHQTRAGPSARRPAKPVLDRICAVGRGRHVRLLVGDATLAAVIDAASRPLHVAADVVVAATLVVTNNDNDFDIHRDGLLIAGDLDFADARRIALQSLLMALMPDGEVAALLHASAVAIDGRALVLAGATTSGKTTLTAYLAATGADYLTDDFTALMREGTDVARFPLAASLKQASWPLLREVLPDLDAYREHQVGDRVVRYVDLGRGQANAASTARVGVLVFPQFTPGAQTLLEPLSPEQALAELMTTGSEVVGAPRSIAPLARLVNALPAWHLRYSDLASARSAIEGVL